MNERSLRSTDYILDEGINRFRIKRLKTWAFREAFKRKNGNILVFYQLPIMTTLLEKIAEEKNRNYQSSLKGGEVPLYL